MGRRGTESDTGGVPIARLRSASHNANKRQHRVAFKGKSCKRDAELMEVMIKGAPALVDLQAGAARKLLLIQAERSPEGTARHGFLR